MKYDAFISYRHLPRDMYVAKGIHKALETAKIPKKIQQLTGKKKIQRVFRDQEELPIGSDLGENIVAALAESEYLIIICTPQTKESVWVMKEIDTFIAMHGRSNILAVLAEGEPEESFPQQILRDDLGNPVEPLAADVRGTDKKEISKKIKSECLRLAAAIIGCDYDDLRQRHRERIMRRYVMAAAAVAAVSVVFGIYNAYNLQRINENYQQKLINESRALAKTSADVLAAGDRKTAALIAMEGLPHEGTDRPFVAETMYSLAKALNSYKLASGYTVDKALTHDWKVEGFDCNDECTRMVSYDDHGGLYYWDTTTGVLLFKILPENSEEGKSEIKGAAISGSKVIAVSSYSFKAYDEEGNVLYDTSFDKEVRAVSFTANNGKVAIMTRDDLRVYDTETGKYISGYRNWSTYGFGDKVAISNDGAYVAFCYSLDSGVGIISTTGAGSTPLDEEQEKISGYDIIEMFFTPDGGFTYVYKCIDSDNKENYGQIRLKKLEPETFRESFDILVNDCKDGTFYFDTSIRAREYNNGSGLKSEILCKTTNALYTYDLYDGSLINEFTSESKINRMLYDLDSSTVLLLTGDGMLSCVDSVTGENTDGFRIKTVEGATDVRIGGNYIVLQTPYESTVTVMTYYSDPDATKLHESSGYLSGGCLSASENTFAFSCKNFTDEKTYIEIFDSKTSEVVGELSLPNINVESMYYLNDDTLVISYFEKYMLKMLYYSISEDKFEEEVFEGDNYYISCSVSSNGSSVAFYSSQQALVVDVWKKEKIYEGELIEFASGDYVDSLTVSDDGSTVYYSTEDKKAFRVDTASGEILRILEDYWVEALFFTDDMTIVMAACTDGKLRSFSTEDYSLLEEIDFYGNKSSLVSMTEDKTRICLSGSDNLFRLYDRNLHDFIYESDEDMGSIKYVQEDQDNNRLVLISNMGLAFFDLESNGFLTFAVDGRMYIHDPGYIISYNSETFYRFDVKSLEDLLEDVKEQFGDAALTPSQKRKYNIG